MVIGDLRCVRSHGLQMSAGMVFWERRNADLAVLAWAFRHGGLFSECSACGGHLFPIHLAPEQFR